MRMTVTNLLLSAAFLHLSIVAIYVVAGVFFDYERAPLFAILFLGSAFVEIMAATALIVRQS